MSKLPKMLFLIPLYFISCTTSQIEGEFLQPEEQAVIGFNAKVQNSRATVSSVSDIDEFKVYAVKSTEPDEDYEQGSDVDYIHILEDERVYWDENLNIGNGGYTYDHPQYWVNNRAFHFFGCYPYKTVTEIDNDGVSYSLTYLATAKSALEKDDLLTFHYSTHTLADQAEYDAVSITFNRALTQISAEITQDFTSNPYDKFCVTSVTFLGIKAGGTLTTSRFDKTGEWHFTEDKLSFSEEYTGEGRMLTKEDDSDKAVPLVVFEGLNLVPQKIEKNTMAFVVDYTYQQGDEKGLVGEVEEKEATIYLPISEWKAGMKYNYKMGLYENNIIEIKNINVSSWGEQPDAGTIIIK